MVEAMPLLIQYIFKASPQTVSHPLEFLWLGHFLLFGQLLLWCHNQVLHDMAWAYTLLFNFSADNSACIRQN